MTPIARAYEAGRAAREEGKVATSNPHDDWELGVAWAAGWHQDDSWVVDEYLMLQASLIPLIHNEGGYTRTRGDA